MVGRFGTPGDRLTTNSRFAQFLAQQNNNNGTIPGGLAHALNQGLIGFALGQDRDQGQAANQALLKGLNPTLPEGVQGPLPQGGFQTAAANLGELGAGGNEQAGRLAQQLAVMQAQQQAKHQQALELAQFKQRFAPGTAPVRNFSRLQELEKEFGKNSPEVRQFKEFVRASKSLNLGDRQVVLDPANPNQPAASFGVGAPPKTSIDTKNNRVIVAPPVSGGGAGGQSGPSTSEITPPKAMQTKARSALQGFERQTKVVESNIDEALRLIGPFSTGFGAFLGGMPESDAGKLRNTLDTIKANIGFDRLQQMRDNSPTGGALGQVSEFENRLLQAVQGALDPKQSKQLETNLNNIKRLYGEVLKERRAAFKTDFGGGQKRRGIRAEDVQALKADPALADQFDAKFGRGAAKRALGQ